MTNDVFFLADGEEHGYLMVHFSNNGQEQTKPIRCAGKMTGPGDPPEENLNEAKNGKRQGPARRLCFPREIRRALGSVGQLGRTGGVFYLDFMGTIPFSLAICNYPWLFDQWR